MRCRLEAFTKTHTKQPSYAGHWKLEQACAMACQVFLLNKLLFASHGLLRALSFLTTERPSHQCADGLSRTLHKLFNDLFTVIAARLK